MSSISTSALAEPESSRPERLMSIDALRGFDMFWIVGGDDIAQGLLSTIPAVATALLGVLAGHWLLSARGRWQKALGRAVAGLACLGVGTLWGESFPIETISQRIFGGLARLSGDLRPVVVATGTVVLEWLLLLHLYRNQIFLRV